MDIFGGRLRICFSISAALVLFHFSTNNLTQVNLDFKKSGTFRGPESIGADPSKPLDSTGPLWSDRTKRATWTQRCPVHTMIMHPGCRPTWGHYNKSLLTTGGYENWRYHAIHLPLPQLLHHLLPCFLFPKHVASPSLETPCLSLVRLHHRGRASIPRRHCATQSLFSCRALSQPKRAQRMSWIAGLVCAWLARGRRRTTADMETGTNSGGGHTLMTA